jgi:hypothetical protein
LGIKKQANSNNVGVASQEFVSNAALGRKEIK